VTAPVEPPEASRWRLVLALLVLAITAEGATWAAMYEPPAPSPCVVTTSGQDLCPGVSA
jgi:hypothetical protein